MNNKLQKKYKLNKSSEYYNTFNKGKYKIIHNIHLQYTSNNYNYPRFGLIVSKKVSKKAYERNYIKRKIREYFRIKKLSLSSWDIVFLVKKKFNKESFFLIEKQLDNFLIKK